MSLPVWPSDLPQRFRVEGFSYGFGDGRLRTPMEAGPPKSRRRTSAAARPLTLTFRGSQDTMLRLERFWTEDVADGALPFLLPDPRSDGLRLLADATTGLLNEAGRPLLVSNWLVCLFGDTAPSQAAVTGTLMQISMPITVLP